MNIDFGAHYFDFAGRSIAVYELAHNDNFQSRLLESLFYTGFTFRC